MSSENHNPAHGDPAHPVHADVNFEASDINTRSILRSFLYLGITVGVTFFVTFYIFRFMTNRAAHSDSVMPPSHQDIGPTLPPEPRLQGVKGHVNDPQQDHRDKIAADEKANQLYSWVDKQAGTARIPVDEAMKIIVSKGLPSVPAPAAEKQK
jgi:hypothetical protein